MFAGVAAAGGASATVAHLSSFRTHPSLFVLVVLAAAMMQLL
jgi:hypothetical protein